MVDLPITSGEQEPVYVIEAIPTRGEHAFGPEEAAAEGVPLPPNLRMGPQFGKGAAGRIHAAMDRNLLRHVAVKRLDAKLAKVPMYRDGFVAEAQITGQLEHPNIVPVHELSVTPDGVPYFSMKLVHGKSLAEWLRDPSRPPGSSERIAEGLEIMLKVCDAVAYAHAKGVIHRDLKPENVMVADFGQIYLMDFGLARLTRTKPASGARAQMEAAGPVGTVTHVAPEQARGNPADMDEQSDVFGLGALLYEIVSGRLPYGPSRSFDDALTKAKAGRIVPIDAVTYGMPISRQIKAIVMRAIAPEKSDRYATVRELADDLRSFLRGGLYLPTRTFAPGTRIVVEGEVGDAAYMITSGSCRVFRTVEGREETLATLGEGDVFGEMALLLREPRAASVEAVEQVTAVVLDQETMEQGVGAGGWTSALVRGLASRFRDLEQQVRAAGLRRGGA